MILPELYSPKCGRFDIVGPVSQLENGRHHLFEEELIEEKMIL